MTVNKSKTVTVQLDKADVVDAIRDYAMRKHPSCKKADCSEIRILNESPEAMDVDASATFTFKAKYEVPA